MKTFDITEFDLFKFIFNRNDLPLDKANFIEKSNEFSDALDFYQQVKDSMYKELTYEVKSKIAARIPAYRLEPAVITLHKEAITKAKIPNKLRLAAASVPHLPKVRAFSFLDDGKNFLARIVNVEAKQKLYLFSTKDELLRNFTVTVYPSGESHTCHDNSSAINLETSDDVEKINITFELHQ